MSRKAGAQKGNRHASYGQEWTAHIKWQLENYCDMDSAIERGQALRAIAKVVVQQALAGEWRAIEEIGNRLDGKPAQTIDLQAEVRHRVEELSDAELVDIALGGGLGTAETTGGETVN
jgi:hypothetical protein